MSALIRKLKAEHVNILEILEHVYMLGPGTEEGHNRLMAAKELLLAHLRHEDDELYPILLKTAEYEPALKEILEKFSAEMAEVSIIALEFFAKNCLPTSQKEFAIAYENFADLLTHRIEKEETVIYPYYEALACRE